MAGGLRNVSPDALMAPDMLPSSRMSGGAKRRRSRKSGKKSKRGAKKGGFSQIISDAIVPFGLVALSTRKHRKSSKGGKSRRSRKYKKSKRSRR